MTAPRRTASPRRSTSPLLAKVHIAKKEMGLDDDTYRDVLDRVTGQRSAAGLTDAQLVRVLKDFEAKGFKPKVVAGGKAASDAPRAKPRLADHPSAKKARALWLSLHDLGVVHDRSEAALEAFARRQLGVAKLQWADQAQTYKLIEALKKMAERAGWCQDGSLDDIKARLSELLEARRRG